MEQESILAYVSLHLR